MDKNKLLELYMQNKGAYNGAISGLSFALVFLYLGLLKTLFIAFCVGMGYYIGNQLSRDKNYITNLLDRILPPGTYR